jgi:3-oxoacid CoA-transferase subunit A
MNKIVVSAEEAIKDVFDGATIMVGGFGLCGMPENLIRALAHKGVKHLTTISNNAGVDGFGMGLLLANGQIRRHIGTYVGENKLLEEMVLKGTVQLDLVPQGTFSERIRAGGAGIPAFFTPTGVGTMVAEGKETREFDGRTYVMEHALKADFAFVKAWKGDAWGNLVYRKTARNFNPMMATAAKVTIAEVEELVDVGTLDPDMVHTPSVFVNRIFQGFLGVSRRSSARQSAQESRYTRIEATVATTFSLGPQCQRLTTNDQRFSRNLPKIPRSATAS